MSLEKGRMHSVNGLRRLMLFIWLSCGDFVSRGGERAGADGKVFLPVAAALFTYGRHSCARG